VAQTGSLSLFTTLATRLNTLRLTACIARLNGLGVEVESPGKKSKNRNMMASPSVDTPSCCASIACYLLTSVNFRPAPLAAERRSRYRDVARMDL